MRKFCQLSISCKNSRSTTILTIIPIIFIAHQQKSHIHFSKCNEKNAIYYTPLNYEVEFANLSFYENLYKDWVYRHIFGTLLFLSGIFWCLRPRQLSNFSPFLFLLVFSSMKLFCEYPIYFSNLLSILDEAIQPPCWPMPSKYRNFLVAHTTQMPI